MNIQWYPGHMTKALRAMRDDIKLVDLIIETADARVPFASRNPEIDSLCEGKARLLLFNKSDLADEAASRSFLKYYEKLGINAIFISTKNKKCVDEITKACMVACREKLERDKKRGISRPIRAMVAGIPNSGKSSIINVLSGRSKAQTGNRPGVTRGNQWIHVSRELELLDTPGILWPRFEDQETGRVLAYTGAINDEILDVTELACGLILKLSKLYPEVLPARYGIISGKAAETLPQAAGILEEIGKKRGCLKKGGEADMAKTAMLVLEEFRGGKLGRITLERPAEAES